MAKIGYVDAAQLPDRNTFEPMPGQHQAVIVDSSMENTKANDGSQFLLLEMVIVGGPFDGRKIQERLNLINNNPTAVKIAQGTLKEIIHAQGKVAISDDSAELHGVPMLIEIEVEPPKGNYGPQNRIKKYLPLNGAAPQQQPPAATAPAATAPAATQYAPPPAAVQPRANAFGAPQAPNSAPAPHAPVGGSPPPWKRQG